MVLKLFIGKALLLKEFDSFAQVDVGDFKRYYNKVSCLHMHLFILFLKLKTFRKQ